MIRSQLVRRLSKAHPGLTARELNQVLTVFFEAISAHLEKGGRVEIRGFGAFSLRERPGRMGRNPRNGKYVPIDGKYVPFFRPGKEIRDRLNG